MESATYSAALLAQVHTKLLAQWRNLQDAKLGTFKHWLYRCPQPPPRALCLQATAPRSPDFLCGQLVTTSPVRTDRKARQEKTMSYAAVEACWLPSDCMALSARARRLAQGVLSREDPEESFLKGVPTEPDSLELVFPVSLLLPTHRPCLHACRLWAACMHAAVG